MAQAPSSQTDYVYPDGCDPARIDPSIPPEGKHLIHILLKNQSFPLKGTGCSGSNDRGTLHHLLAITLGAALDSNADKLRRAVISGGCKAEQFELRSGATIDGWRCSLHYEETFIKDDEWVATSSISFGVHKATWELITDSVTPNPPICIP